MKPSNFAKHLTEFFTNYLQSQKNVSKNTIHSYRDTFKLLIKFCDEAKDIKVEKITINCISQDLIIEFLQWLEDERKCSITTRNQRLTAIHSFFRYLQMEEPESIFNFQKIMSIPSKKSTKTLVEHLTPEAIQLILEQPDRYTKKGRRDLTLLSVLYDTGARVQELIDIKVCDVILENPAVIILNGKGNKTRRVPITKNTVALLESYTTENNLNNQSKNQYPLFMNSQKTKLTKEGIAYILTKYVTMAREKSNVVPEKAHPHQLRHSKAMHLLQAEVEIIYIRDFLGHVDLKTTEIYARADTEMKRKAIESVCTEIIDSNLPDWNNDQALLSWLSEL